MSSNYATIYPVRKIIKLVAEWQYMKARFATKCVACGDMIKVGKEIAKNSEDVWVHKHCIDDSDEFP